MVSKMTNRIVWGSSIGVGLYYLYKYYQNKNSGDSQGGAGSLGGEDPLSEAQGLANTGIQSGGLASDIGTDGPQNRSLGGAGEQTLTGDTFEPLTNGGTYGLANTLRDAALLGGAFLPSIGTKTGAAIVDKFTSKAVPELEKDALKTNQIQKGTREVTKATTELGEEAAEIGFKGAKSWLRPAGKLFSAANTIPVLGTIASAELAHSESLGYGRPRSETYVVETGLDIATITAGAGAGALAGSVVPGFGTAVGAVVGTGVTIAGQIFFQDEAYDVYDKLTKASGYDYNSDYNPNMSYAPQMSMAPQDSSPQAAAAIAATGGALLLTNTGKKVMSTAPQQMSPITSKSSAPITPMSKAPQMSMNKKVSNKPSTPAKTSVSRTANKATTSVGGRPAQQVNKVASALQNFFSKVRNVRRK